MSKSIYLIRRSALGAVLRFVELKWGKQVFTELADKRNLFEGNGYMDIALYSGMLENLSEVLDELQLGFKLSECYTLANMGLFGKLIKSSRNIREAISSSQQFLDLYVQGVGISLEDHGSNTRIVITIDPKAELGKQFSHLCVGTVYWAILSIFGEADAAQVKSIGLPNIDSDTGKTHGGFCGLPVVKALTNGYIEVHTECLNYNFKSHNKNISDHIQACLAAEVVVGRTISDNTKRVIFLQMQMQNRQKISIADVAQELNVGVRNLQYLLQEEGATFLTLLDECRKEFIFRYMAVSEDRSVSSLCKNLGYSDLSTFNRAFKRWFGKSPRQWIKESL
jgi:AraC-like DNA-binding protein